jgi:hypothetical protein
MLLKVALSIALIVVMELFLNRSVKILSSLSLEGPRKLAFHKGCEMTGF